VPLAFSHTFSAAGGDARSFSRPHILPQVSSQAELLADLLRKGGM
jgi:hypothetical protein